MILPSPSPSAIADVAIRGKRELHHTDGRGGILDPVASRGGRSPEDTAPLPPSAAIDARPRCRWERGERDDARDLAPPPLATKGERRMGSRCRVSSREWVKDLSDPDLDPLLPTVFADDDYTIGAADDPSARRRDHDDCRLPLADLSAPLGRDWILFAEQLNRSDPGAGPLLPTTFADDDTTCAVDVSLTERHDGDEYTPLPLESDWVLVAEHLSPPPPNMNAVTCAPVTSGYFPPPMMPFSSPLNPDVMEYVPLASASPNITVATDTANNALPSSFADGIKKRSRRRRQIDESHAVEPTDNDVLFGRGSHTNKHPGNVKFRRKALELRSWYTRSSTTQEEKRRIANLLVESVNGRFLERGTDGGWHEVLGEGARRKASQVLREHLRGARRASQRHPC